MRTGAIFARGSCRALRWMALAGMAFALGSAQAAAQITVPDPPTSYTEEEATVIEVDIEGEIPLGQTALSVVTLTVTVTAGDATLSDDGVVILRLPGNATATADATPIDETLSISVTPDEDDDAADASITVSWSAVVTGPARTTGNVQLTANGTIGPLDVEDDETQRYDLQLLTRQADLEEGKSIEYRIIPNPPLDATLTNPDVVVELELSEDYPFNGNLDTGPFDDGSAEVTFGSGGGARTDPAIIDYMSDEDDDSNNETVTLTIYWGTGSASGRTSNTVTLMDPDDDEPAAAGDLTFMPATQPNITSGVVMGTAITAMQLPTVTTGMGTAPYMYTATGLPAGLTVALGTGMLTGTPTAAAGTTMVTYTATDSSSPALTGSLTFSITVAAAGTPPATTATDGIITAVVVKDAPVRRIGGVERVHVTEGDLTEVLVTVEWNHAQVTALWVGYTLPNRPPPAMVQLEVAAETNAVWLSPAETDEDPGPGYQAGYDAVLASGALGRRVSIAIPTKPTATQDPMSTSRFRAETGSISLSLPHDTDAEDEGFRINVVEGTGVFVSTSDSRSRKSTLRAIVIEDDETQGIVLSRNPASTAAIFEGGKAPFKAIADPPREDLELQVRYNVTTLEGVSVSSREYTLDGSIGTIPVGIDSDANPARDLVTFSTPKNDANRTDDDFRIHAEVVSFDLGSGAFDDIDESFVDITVLDVHRLPTLTVSPEESTVEEGESVELTLTLDRDPARDRARRTGGEKNDVTSEPVTVMLTMGAGTTADMDDYRLPRTVTFPKHDGKAPWTQDAMVEVMALDDTELDEMEMLVLDAMIAGTVVANGTEKETVESVAMLTIEEGTTNLVWAKTEEEVYAVLNAAKADGLGDDMTFNPGEMIEVMGSAMFNAAEGVTLSFTADSDNEDVATESVSGGMVMVTAEDMAGMAHITVTAHASMPSGVMIADQTDPREASIMFPVEVGLEALTIMLELDGDDMNVAEGMSATVTAMANRAVTEDTMVTLMRDRSMSTADDMDFDAEPIMIEAGEMMGSTMVMAVEDDMAEDMEELVLYGMAADNAGEVTGEVTLYLWDAAVPALPLIAQLLLAALLGLGGYRRYLRRR